MAGPLTGRTTGPGARLAFRGCGTATTSSPIIGSVFFTSPTQLPVCGDESAVIACHVERMGKEGVLNVHKNGGAGNGVVHTVYAVLVVVFVE